MYLAVGDESLGMILPGLPMTIELSGTSKLTKAPGAIKTLSPICIPPPLSPS